MLLVTTMAVLIHVFIIIKAIIFFRTGGTCRESDKHSVACIALLSVLFLLSQGLVWVESPPKLTEQLSGPMFLAYNFAVAILFLGQIQLVTNHRSAHKCRSPS